MSSASAVPLPHKPLNPQKVAHRLAESMVRHCKPSCVSWDERTGATLVTYAAEPMSLVMALDRCSDVTFHHATYAPEGKESKMRLEANGRILVELQDRCHLLDAEHHGQAYEETLNTFRGFAQHLD